MRSAPRFQVVTRPSTSSMKMAYSLTPSTRRRKRSSLSRRISWVRLDESPNSDGCIGTIALPPTPEVILSHKESLTRSTSCSHRPEAENRHIRLVILDARPAGFEPATGGLEVQSIVF